MEQYLGGGAGGGVWIEKEAISDKITLQKTLQRSRKTVYSLIIFNDTTWTPATFQRHGI